MTYTPETDEHRFQTITTDATSCPHPKPKGMIHLAESHQDVSYIRRNADVFDGTTVNLVPTSMMNDTMVFYRGVVLCDDCNAKLPSVKAEAAKRAEQKLTTQERERKALQDRIDTHEGDPLHRCPNCDEVKNESDLVPVRFCTFCDAGFDASDGRNCTECNRPFSRKVTLVGCPDCLSEEEDMVPVALTDDEVKALTDDDV
jgi:hypothetical protein